MNSKLSIDLALKNVEQEKDGPAVPTQRVCILSDDVVVCRTSDQAQAVAFARLCLLSNASGSEIVSAVPSHVRRLGLSCSYRVSFWEDVGPMR